MEPVRFDAFARALATPASRRSFLKGAGAALLAYLLPIKSRAAALPADQAACGRPVRWEDGRAFCPANCLPCWDTCVNPQVDEKNCGGCGITCAAGRTCRDGVCGENPHASEEICRAITLRLWLNAFVPGVVPNYVRPGRTLNGRPVSVYPAPLPASNEGGDLWLLTDRPSSNPETTLPDPSFTPNPNAPAQAHAEIEIKLDDLTMLNQPKAVLGSIVQVDSGAEGARTRICDRSIKEAANFSDHLPLLWFRDRPKSQQNPNVLDLELKAAWSLGDVDPDAATRVVDTACALNTGVAALPMIQIKGTIRITRDDTNRNVLIQLLDLDGKAPGSEMSPFPAFEMYAALDDGHLVQVFAHQSAIWSDNLGDSLVSSGTSNTVTLPCGCGDCFAGFSCGTSGCSPVAGYYIISSDSALSPAKLPADVDINAELTVQINRLSNPVLGSRRIYQSKKSAGQVRIAPIGFTGEEGEELVITASGIHGDPPVTSRVFLNRITGLYSDVSSTELEWKQAEADRAGQPRFEARFKFPQDQPGPSRGICCVNGTGQVCVDHMVDPLNCGGCLNQCAPTQICLDGNCVCPSPQIFDGGRCVDGLVDDHACGTRAPLEDCTLDGRICVDGTCVVPCGQGQTHCGPGVGCVDTRTNASHCNGCGNACPSGQICEAGACRCQDAGFAFCPDAGCVDTTSNASHCSDCGISCPSGEICVNSACQCPNEGEKFCTDIGCVDIRSSQTNCGDCGIICDGTQTCVNSFCQCADPTMTNCGGFCTDTQTDPGHCNTCDSTFCQCCVGGVCDPPGIKLCSGFCVDTSSDPDNCGDCGVFCPGCFQGTCPEAPVTGPESCHENEHWNGVMCEPDFLGPEG